MANARKSADRESVFQSAKTRRGCRFRIKTIVLGQPAGKEDKNHRLRAAAFVRNHIIREQGRDMIHPNPEQTHGPRLQHRPAIRSDM